VTTVFALILVAFGAACFCAGRLAGQRDLARLGRAIADSLKIK
jgi:hypothetical protein